MGSLSSKIDSKNQVVELRHSDVNFDKALLNKYKDLINSKGIMIVKINVDKLNAYYTRFYEKIKSFEKFTSIEAFGSVPSKALKKNNYKIFAGFVYDKIMLEYLKSTEFANLSPNLQDAVKKLYSEIEIDIVKTQSSNIDNFIIADDLIAMIAKILEDKAIIIKRNKITSIDDQKKIFLSLQFIYLRLIDNTQKFIDEIESNISVDNLAKAKPNIDIALKSLTQPKDLENNALMMLAMGSLTGFYTILDETKPNEPKSKEVLSQVKIVIPRVLLENDQTFITFLIYEFQKNSSGKETELFAKFLKSVLDGLNKNTKNREVRFANSINLILNLALMGGVIAMAKDKEKLMIELITEFSGDFFSMMPDTKCYFIKDNYVEFEPDVCKEAEKKLECPKQECPAPICPKAEVSCPKAEVSCPKAEVSCPPCPVPKIPECPKTDLTGTNDLIQSNKLFSYLNIFLIIVLIVLLGYNFLTKSKKV
jgi:hypothetical protein